MGRFPLVLLGAMAALSLLPACKEKVDCKKMQSRLTTCMHDNYVALNKAGRDLKDPRFKKDANDVAARYTKLIDKHYFDVCESIGGRERRAKKVNTCLSQASCSDVHACLKEVFK